MSNSTGKSPVLAAVDDLFFWSKIESVARNLGVAMSRSVDPSDLELRLAESTPRLILIDLNSRTFPPFETIARLKGDPRLRETQIVGFFSHVQVELVQRAKEAGCDLVLPRSAFSARLPQILKAQEP
jgi:PleD family two-component response regulator